MDFYSLCTQCYKSDAWVVAYQGTIYIVPSELEWEVPDEVKNLTVLPPNVKFHKGKPKRKRFPYVREVKHKKK